MSYDPYKYVAVCLVCGKSSGIKQNGSSMGGPPTRTPPNIGGKCPANPSGKHAPAWRPLN